jgi:hypothetical protein
MVVTLLGERWTLGGESGEADGRGGGVFYAVPGDG